MNYCQDCGEKLFRNICKNCQEELYINDYQMPIDPIPVSDEWKQKVSDQRKIVKKRREGSK